MTTLLGQEQEAPRYNHPRGDLLDNEKRGEYIKTCVPLYIALMEGDLKAARVILEDHEDLVRYCITEQKETPLHVVAAVPNDPEFVKYLVDMMSEDDLELQNEEGNNAFCVAAIAGNRSMAMIMLQKNRQLLSIRGSGNKMPLYLAAFHKQRDMITYLYDNSRRMASDDWTNEDRNIVFLECIKINCFDVALQMLNDREELPDDDEYLWNMLWVLAQKDNAFYEPIPISTIKRLYMKIFGLEIVIKEREITLLLRKIWKKIVVKNNKDEIDVILRGPPVGAEKETYPCRILFVAAENGKDKFLVELIREYPDLIWKTNDDGQTIFHTGVIHGHENIIDLLKVLGAMKNKITKLKDKHGNTLLHSVSMKTGRYSHRGAASYLRCKLQWFKDVEALVPPSYKLMKNVVGQTPKELFNQHHEDLLPKGEKWVKETSNQCMVVATLVATIAFAAAFTIPGGYNQTSGYPIFLKNPPFLAVVILDAISFILSSIAILCFLSLSFSRYSEDDFLDSVPMILLGGLDALTYSILTLMAAFSASFFIIYHNKLLTVPIIMSSLAYIPLFVLSIALLGVLETLISRGRRKNIVLFNQHRRF